MLNPLTRMGMRTKRKRTKLTTIRQINRARVRLGWRPNTTRIQSGGGVVLVVVSFIAARVALCPWHSLCPDERKTSTNRICLGESLNTAGVGGKTDSNISL